MFFYSIFPNAPKDLGLSILHFSGSSFLFCTHFHSLELGVIYTYIALHLFRGQQTIALSALGLFLYGLLCHGYFVLFFTPFKELLKTKEKEEGHGIWLGKPKLFALLTLNRKHFLMSFWNINFMSIVMILKKYSISHSM